MFYYSNCISGVVGRCNTIIDLINNYPISVPPPPNVDIKPPITTYTYESHFTAYKTRFCSLAINTEIAFSLNRRDDYNKLIHHSVWTRTERGSPAVETTSTQYFDDIGYYITGGAEGIINYNCDEYHSDWEYPRILDDAFPYYFLEFVSDGNNAVAVLYKNTENNINTINYLRANEHINPVPYLKRLEKPDMVLFYDTRMSGVGTIEYDDFDAYNSVRRKVKLNIDINSVIASVYFGTPCPWSPNYYTVYLTRITDIAYAYIILFGRY